MNSLDLILIINKERYTTRQTTTWLYHTHVEEYLKDPPNAPNDLNTEEIIAIIKLLCVVCDTFSKEVCQGINLNGY